MIHGKQVIAIFGLVFITMAAFCFLNNDFVNVILEKFNTFFPILTLAIIGPSGYALTRLNVFDKLDDLQEKDAAKVNIESLIIRKSIYSILIFMGACSLIIFISGLLISSKTILTIYSIDIDFKGFMAIFFSFTISATFMLLFVVARILINIEELRSIVLLLANKEKKRKKLLTEMYEEKDKNPFNEMDFHLKKYNQVIKGD